MNAERGSGLLQRSHFPKRTQFTSTQTCTGVARTGSYRGSFGGGKAVLDGFTPGTFTKGRVRKIGTGGEGGNYSDPASLSYEAYPFITRNGCASSDLQLTTYLLREVELD